MVAYAPKKGDYVSWEESGSDGKETRYGTVKELTASSASPPVKSTKVTPYNPKEGGSEDDGITKPDTDWVTAKLKKSNWARMKVRSKANIYELGENVIVASAYHAFIQKNRLFGPENVSFMIADATHEFLIKGFAESMMDILAPTSLTKDGDALFQTADLSDMARKLPFVFGLQQAIQHFLFRKPFNHQVMSNLFGDAGILVCF